MKLSVSCLSKTLPTMLTSRNDIKKSPSALHLRNLEKSEKFHKNTFFIREIAANFNNFQGSSTSMQKLLLT